MFVKNKRKKAKWGQYSKIPRRRIIRDSKRLSLSQMSAKHGMSRWWASQLYRNHTGERKPKVERLRKPWVTKDKVRKLARRLKSKIQIARRLDVTPETLNRYASRYNIALPNGNPKKITGGEIKELIRKGLTAMEIAEQSRTHVQGVFHRVREHKSRTPRGFWAGAVH